MMFRLLIFLLLSLPILVNAQQEGNPHKIKKPKSLFGDRCKDYETTLKKLPRDIRYNVEIIDRVIYIVTPSLEHFQQLYNKSRDGIAIDIIHNDLYKCDEEIATEVAWLNKGYLLAPLYKKELEKNIYFDQLNNVVIRYGILPEQFDPSEIECNILIIQKKALCDYTILTNIDYSNWDLLEMGFYWDSIPESGTKSRTHTLSKTIEFTIPFEKNKARFSPTDIKPLYDSLELTDYDIMEISILAFTSIEGSFKLNEKLQQGRAQSIVDALQAYQTQQIKTNILTKENWVQFAEDISGTRFQYLKGLSKEEVKNLLSKDKELLSALEPMLEKQRKGMIKLVLQKKLSALENDPQKLKEVFNQSLSEDKLEQALFLQHLIFERIRNEKLPDDFITQLTIPKESSNGPLFNNILLFNWERQNTDLDQTIHKMESLQALTPDNYKLKYNLVALKLKAWAEGNTLNTNGASIEKLIKELDKTTIHPSLLERLKINYNLLLTQHLTYQKKFKEKRKSVKNIYYHYKKIALTDEDLLRLANFLTYYSEFGLATDILQPRATKENVSEDLLFFYLNLTLGDPKMVNSSAYDRVLQKAVELNKARYCKLFFPKPQGGYTFQLKDSSKLKASFCEHCRKNEEG